MLPAYLDNVLYFFDDESLKNRGYVYPSNYGMVPVNIVLNKNDVSGYQTSAYSFDNGCHCYLEDMENKNFDSFCDNFTISFYTLSKWYHEFEEYYALLNDHSHCGLVYESAEDYYNHESGQKYRDQMIYGADKQTYIDLDEKILSMGGNPKFNEENGETVDEGFYKWICENIVPSFTIPFKYQEYWKTKKLYYPDVIEWMAWFNERVNKYEGEGYYFPPTSSSPESWNCKKDGTDCCDCEEYFNRGGKRVYQAMVDWCDSLQSGITAMNEIISRSSECFIPTIILPGIFQTSIEDVGQFSIFSKEYEAGIDYRVASGYGASENTESGTVVTYDDESKILVDGYGFCFDRNLMESFYNESDWKDYTEKFIDENRQMFVVSGYDFYAFDEDGTMITGNTEIELEYNLKKKYDIIFGDYIIGSDGILRPVEETEYGTIWNSANGVETKYYVYRDEYTKTPYTIIDGKTIYAEFYQNTGKGGPVFYFDQFKVDNTESAMTYSGMCSIVDDDFNINKYKIFKRNELSETIKHVDINGVIFDIGDSGNSFYIDGIEFNEISGYSIDDNGNYLCCFNSDGNVYILENGVFYKREDIEIDDDKMVVDFIDTPIIYNVREITGTTESKIYGLRATNLLVDMVGNTIEGIYDVQNKNNYNHQPPQGSDIEPMYQVGNVSNVGVINGLTVLSATTADTNYFIGDIITEMSFYYKETDGSVFDDGKYTIYLTDSGTTKLADNSGAIIGNIDTSYKSLSAINYANSAKTLQENEQNAGNSEEYILFDDDMYCDITYYIGATLKRSAVNDSGSTPFYMAYSSDTESNNYNYGVEYKETVKVKKTPTEFYIKKKNNKVLPITINRSMNHSLSYPIYTYVFEQETTDITSGLYNNVRGVPLAKFKAEINIIDDDLNTTFSRYKDMKPYNDVQVYPVFKEEYLLGVSSIENLDANIYIERGINAAFERHLKLGEVRTLDDLVTYGNGYFKIMED